MVETLQVPAIILPTVWTTGIETEDIDDLLEHTSIEFPVEYLREKTIQIMAMEFIVAGVPGVLNCWVEVSPYPTANSAYWPAPNPISAVYWAAIGGGGGLLPPTVPVLEVATGVPLTVHPIIISWNTYHPWARLVIQTPVAAALPAAYWIVQAMVEGQA